MVTALGNLIPTHDSFSRNALKNKQPCEIEPIIDFNDTKYPDIIILPYQRSRSNPSNLIIMDDLFEDEILNSSTGEMTRKIILEPFTLAQAKSKGFLDEMNKDFSQLAKNEILEISSQIPLDKKEWMCFSYKKMLIRIGSNFRKIYATKKSTVIRKGSFVFRIKSIEEI